MTGSSSPYRVRSPETWAQAREAYLEGEAAESVCARFDLGLSAFRRRSRLEGWRREDQPDPEPLDAGIDLDEMEDPDLSVMIEMAARRLHWAVRTGRSVEALRYVRLHRALTLMAAEEDALPPAPEPAPARTADGSAPEADGLHELHPEFPPAPPPAVQAMLSRAERRRKRRDERLRRSSA